MVEEITVEDLKGLNDSNEGFCLIDTRPAEDFEEWHIQDALNFEYSPSDKSFKVSYEELRNRFELERSDKIVTICAKGISSYDFAKDLEEIGFKDVSVVRGGMEAWSGVYDIVEIPTKNDDLEIIQFQRRSKGCLGYLIGSKNQKEAALIDISRYIDVFKEEAEKRGYEIKRIFDTHIQADHLMGGKELSKELGIPYHLGSNVEKRGPEFNYEPIVDEEFVVGKVTINPIHTPGHTTEMTSYEIDGEAIITGDSLFVESIGRTELEFSGDEVREGAEMQYESMKKIMGKPGDMKVLPSHFSVTSAGEYVDVVPSEPIYSTVKHLRDNNRALKMDKDEFVSFIVDNVPSKPPNYEEIISVNLGRKEVESESDAIELELGPNRCAASEESMVSKE